METVVEMRDIRKSFGGKMVLDGVSLEIARGETLSIIGPSGSGKSTLLRLATLLDTPDGGELSYGGERAFWMEGGRLVQAGAGERRRIKRYFGLVFQSFHLFPHFTVLQNIMDAPVQVLGRKPQEVREQARALLDRLGLADKEDAYPCQLSGGQKQRVSIARALAMEPQVLFFDEPTSALDPELTKEVLAVIRQLAEEKMTMAVVTHEMEFARGISHRMLFMEGGRIAAQGSPEALFRDPPPRLRAFMGL